MHAVSSCTVIQCPCCRAAFLIGKALREEMGMLHAMALTENAARKWATLPIGIRLGVGTSYAVSPVQRDLSLPAVPYVSPFGFVMGETPRTTASPNVGTPDADAVISQRTEILHESEEIADGIVSVSYVVRIWVGIVNHGAYYGNASGDLTDYTKVRKAALENAEGNARSGRALMRENTRTLGTGKRVGISLVKGIPAVPLTAEQYGILRMYVSKRVWGNAANGSRSAYIRSGVQAMGMPIAEGMVDDGTHAAVMLICKWVRDGLPESLAESVQEADADTKRALILGSAARDGIRMLTLANRPTSLAQAISKYRARLNADPRKDVDSPTSDRTNVRAMAAPVSVQRTAYVGNGDKGSPALNAILSRPADYPTLFALVLNDESVAAAARSLYGSDSGPMRTKCKRAAIAEWQRLTLTDSAADDSEETAAGDGFLSVR